MENQTLYGYHYVDEGNGDHRMTVYQGIFIPGTPENTRTYPVVRHLGNVNITQRFFLKSRKFPRKVETIEGELLSFNDNMKIKSIQSILNDLGHPQEFIDLVRNTILDTSHNENTGTCEGWQDKLNRYGYIYEQMTQNIEFPPGLTGKVSF